jgi:hypothetical protein
MRVGDGKDEGEGEAKVIVKAADGDKVESTPVLDTAADGMGDGSSAATDGLEEKRLLGRGEGGSEGTEISRMGDCK